MARDEQIRVDLTAKDDASKTIEKVADAAEALEKLAPEIEITADADQAEQEIDRLGDDVREIQRADAEIVLRAKVDNARAELAQLQGDLRQMGEQADTAARQLDRVDGPGHGGGINTRGNAIADLTGPLGEASGAASDFAGVFDGLGDIAEDVAGKLGASAASSAAISGAIGGLGIAVAGAAALWQLYTSRQEAARKKQEELIKGQRELNDALRKGDVETAARNLVELYDDQYDAAQRAGIGARELTDYLTGMTDELPTLEQALRAVSDEQAAAGDVSYQTADAYDQQRLDLINLLGKLTDARAKYAETNGTIREQDQLLGDVTAALGGATRETDRSTRATDAFAAAQGAAAGAVDNTAAELAELQGELDMERALQRFTDDFNVAMWNAADQSADTSVDILGLKQSILDVAEYAQLTPVEVRSLLERIDQGDIAGVKADVEAAYARNPVRIAAQLKVTAIAGLTGAVAGGAAGLTGATITSPGPFPVGSSTVINVTQNLPRGYRERDTLSAARSAARRAGGLYRQARS